jgi:mRNA interferase RelE/StbE
MVGLKKSICRKWMLPAIEPRPNGVKKLQGEENSYRIRVGDYRVIYDIFDDILLVKIVDVGHRSKVYKDES